MQDVLTERMSPSGLAPRPFKVKIWDITNGVLHNLFCLSCFTDQAVTVGRWSCGMSADYEEILESPKPQKPKVKVPKVVNF